MGLKITTFNIGKAGLDLDLTFPWKQKEKGFKEMLVMLEGMVAIIAGTFLQQMEREGNLEIDFVTRGTGEWRKGQH